MTQTPTFPPAAPRGVPAWLTRLVAAVLGLIGPALAWADPGNQLPHGAIQACVILAFLTVAAAVFLAHLILGAVHEYGWTMNTDAEAEFRRLWPEIKQTYTDAKPALDRVHGFSAALDSLCADVASLKTAGVTPEAVVQAFETATGTTWPRAAAPAAAGPADPATTGQAS